MSETVGAALARVSQALAGAGIPDPARDARALVAHAAGLPPDRVMIERDRVLAPDMAAILDRAVTARMSWQPVAQITGRRLFWGREFSVTPDTLDPRPETETLIALALEGPPAERILDLGTGTGIIPVTLLCEWPGATAVATDISGAALAVARRNAQDLGVADRIEFLTSDWFDGVQGRFDLITSNPPYISALEFEGLTPDVKDWEPRQALTPGGDGLSAYRAIAMELKGHLTPEGKAFFEIGATQGEQVSGIFRAAGFSECRVHKDMDGRDRVVQVTGHLRDNTGIS